MNLIASADLNWGIGYQGNLLYHVKEDMLWFKEHTINKVVIMGRETFESLPGRKPLVDRVNIVITSKPDFTAPGCVIVSDFNQLFSITDKYDSEELFIIGGASIYKQLLHYCDKAYITKFIKSAQADRYLPDFDQLSNWELIETSDDHWHNDLRYNFCIYLNKAPKPRI